MPPGPSKPLLRATCALCRFSLLSSTPASSSRTFHTSSPTTVHRPQKPFRNKLPQIDAFGRPVFLPPSHQHQKRDLPKPTGQRIIPHGQHPGNFPRRSTDRASDVRYHEEVTGHSRWRSEASNRTAAMRRFINGNKSEMAMTRGQRRAEQGEREPGMRRGNWSAGGEGDGGPPLAMGGTSGRGAGYGRRDRKDASQRQGAGTFGLKGGFASPKWEFGMSNIAPGEASRPSTGRSGSYSSRNDHSDNRRGEWSRNNRRDIHSSADPSSSPSPSPSALYTVPSAPSVLPNTPTWNPTKKLTYPAMNGLRHLHASDPSTYTRAVLAEKFGISYEAVSRILRSKFDAASVKAAQAVNLSASAAAGGGAAGGGTRVSRGYTEGSMSGLARITDGMGMDMAQEGTEGTGGARDWDGLTIKEQVQVYSPLPMIEKGLARRREFAEAERRRSGAGTAVDDVD